ncbi:MAG: IPT/TIG domain-containing protein [Enterobacteriaceae bacterium]
MNPTISRHLIHRADKALPCLTGRLCGLLFTLLWLFSTVVRADIFYGYDELGRLISVNDDAGNGALYHYDSSDNMTAIQSAKAGNLLLGELMPKAGPVNSSVTISGSGFSLIPEENTVKFNGVNATVTAAAINRLQVSVPPGSETGVISVTVGATTVSSLYPFTITEDALTPSLQVSSFTPATGLAGTKVTINGKHFDPRVSRVRFNGIYAETTHITPTQIEVRVPSQAGSGPIQIQTAYGVTTSSEDFIIPPKGYTPAQIGLVQRMVVDAESQKLSDIGADGKIALVLVEGVEGEGIGLGISELKTTTGSGGVYLYVYTPDGRMIGDCGYYSTSGGRCTLPALPASGTYTVRVSSGGNYGATLTLTLSTEITGTLNLDGEPQIFPGDRLGQNGRYTFYAQAGEQLGLGIDEVKTNTNNGYMGVGDFSVTAPDGSVVKNCGSYTLHGSSCSLLLLPVSGIYTANIMPRGFYTTGLTLTLSRDVSEVLLADGEQKVFVGDRKGQNGRYRFSGLKGERMGLGIEDIKTNTGNQYIDVVDLSVTAPDGTSFKECGAYTLTGGNCALPPLPDSGNYTVNVIPRKSYRAGLTLTLSKEIIGELIPDGNPQLFPGARVGQRGRYSFNGKEGESLSISLSDLKTNASNRYFSLLQLSVTTADGTSVKNCGDYTLFGGHCTLPTLPASGTYIINIVPKGAYKTSLKLSLSEDPTRTTQSRSLTQ